MDILIRYARKKLPVQVKHADILIRYASLVMPISDPRDRFFYLHHTPMKDTFSSTAKIQRTLSPGKENVLRVDKEGRIKRAAVNRTRWTAIVADSSGCSNDLAGIK